MFKIHLDDNKTQCKKVPLDVPVETDNVASLSGAVPGEVGFCMKGFQRFCSFDCIEFLFFVPPQPKGRAVGREKRYFLKNLVSDRCDVLHASPWLQSELPAVGDEVPARLMSGWCNLELNSRGYQIAAPECLNS